MPKWIPTSCGHGNMDRDYLIAKKFYACLWCENLGCCTRLPLEAFAPFDNVQEARRIETEYIEFMKRIAHVPEKRGPPLS